MESLAGITRRRDISFYKGGRIDITARVAAMLHIHDGDVIDIAKSYNEYYLYIRYNGDSIIGRHQGTCHMTKKNSHNFRAYSATLVNKILSICKKDNVIPDCAFLPVGKELHNEDGTVLVPLITLNNMYLK